MKCALCHLAFASLLATAGLLITAASAATAPEINYDESKVPGFTLPDPLRMSDGTLVPDAKTWTRKRRPEVLALFESHVYGRSPTAPGKLEFEILSSDAQALDGFATRKQIRIYPLGDRTGPRMDLLLYLPNATRKPVPAFLGMNFGGNHTIHADPGILITDNWVRPGSGAINNRANSASRGQSSGAWPIEKILKRGYALATLYYGDLEPDWEQGWKSGIRSRFTNDHATWGAIGAWAWGLSRALDYLEKDKQIDANRVALLGHSRLGKASLWAGAQDERFAIVISNESGCGGAALSRRRFGETVQRINTAFPHWFCEKFKQYNDREDDLPVDQHQLITLIAPRPVYIASAEEDRWADPKGEFLSAKLAEPVYALFGKTGLGVDEMPSVNHPVCDTIAYHIRTGKHDVTEFDWDQYLNFADRHFR